MGLECLVKLSLKDEENQILKLSRTGKERKGRTYCWAEGKPADSNTCHAHRRDLFDSCRLNGT